MAKKNIFEKAYELIDNARAKATKVKCREAESRVEDIYLRAAYAEPGYTSKSGCIATGNWNAVKKYENNEFKLVCDIPAKLGEALEKLGVDLEWSDEWATCEACNKLIRTSANSYSWQPSYWDGEGCGYYCHECVKAAPQGYLESLEGSTKHCETIGLDLTAHGFVQLLDNLQNGWHGGQSADPKVIGKALRELGIERFIFKLDSVGQFDIQFSVFVHESEIDKADGKTIKTDGADPAEGLKRALQQASIQHAQHKGGGIVVSKCDTATGTCETKVVSPEDFVAGNALK